MDEIVTHKPLRIGRPEEPAPGRDWLKLALFAGLGLLVAGGLAAALLGYLGRRKYNQFSKRADLIIADYRGAHPPADEAENAAALFEKALDLYALPPKIGPLVSPTPDPEAVRAYVQSNARCLAALMEATGKPALDFGFDVAKGAAPMSGDVLRFRDMSILLALSARQAAESGRPQEGLDLAGRLLWLGANAGRPGLLVFRKTQTACELAVPHTLQRVLSASEPPAPAVEALLGRVTAYAGSRSKLPAAFDATRAWFLVSIRNELAAAKGEKLAARRADGLRDAALLEAHLEASAARAEKPYWQVAAGLSAEAEDRAIDRLPEWRSFSKALLRLVPLPSDLIADEAGAVAGLQAARLGLGCRLCRLKTGKYPETLDELAEGLPEQFPELPADPCTGEPFRYRRTGKGCLVWSAGRDRADDGGDPKTDLVFELKQ